MRSPANKTQSDKLSESALTCHFYMATFKNPSSVFAFVKKKNSENPSIAEAKNQRRLHQHSVYKKLHKLPKGTEDSAVPLS